MLLTRGGKQMIKLIAQTEAINSLVLQGVNFFFVLFLFYTFLFLFFFVFWKLNVFKVHANVPQHCIKAKKTENSYMFLNKMVQQCSESEFNSQLKKWLIC